VGPTPDGIRRRAKPDMYPLFQLYSACVPERVRRYEAMTLNEWTAAQESIGRGSQYVVESEGRMLGWLRVAGDGDVGRFDLIAEPAARDELIDCALAKLANRERVHAIVTDFQEDVSRRLEELGFAPGDEYTVLVRRTVRPVKSARRVPAVAQTTFG
jgi:hypothetical protein